jgi:hypothetical protein
MKDWLVGEYYLEIKGIHNSRNDSDRYLAEVIKAPDSSIVGEYVNVRFVNNGNDPQSYIGKKGLFNGVDNDIRKNPSYPKTDPIGKEKRPGSTYKNPFDSAGSAKGDSHRLRSDIQDAIYPDEINEEEKHYEGAKKSVKVNVYERNKGARKKCIEHYGAKCIICGFNFSETYDGIGYGFIHVHHIKPLSEINEEYKVDPINDLIPVCPNCHSVIHKSKEPYTIKEVQNMLKNNAGAKAPGSA